MTWGIKIAEFLVEMELFPHYPKSNEGGKPFKMSILMSVAFDAKKNTQKPKLILIKKHMMVGQVGWWRSAI